MHRTKRIFLMCLLVLTAVFLIACGGGSTDTGDSTGGGDASSSGDGSASSADEPQRTSVPTMAASGVQGLFYLGEVLPPQAGIAAAYVHEDNRMEMVMIVEGSVEDSFILIGELTGQRVDIAAEASNARGTGRTEQEAFEINVTVPGSGFMRVLIKAADTGGLYLGESNGYVAAAIVTADGSVLGLVAVEGGDEPVYEFVCYDGVVDGNPDTLMVTSCESGTEVEVTLQTD